MANTSATPATANGISHASAVPGPSPLAPPVPIETLKAWHIAGGELAASMLQNPHMKFDPDTALELAKQSQIVLQHLGATVNPLYAALGTWVGIVAMHGYGAYQLGMAEKAARIEEARRNAVQS